MSLKLIRPYRCIMMRIYNANTNERITHIENNEQYSLKETLLKNNEYIYNYNNNITDTKISIHTIDNIIYKIEKYIGDTPSYIITYRGEYYYSCTQLLEHNVFFVKLKILYKIESMTENKIENEAENEAEIISL